MNPGLKIRHARKRSGLTLERLSSISAIGVSSLSEFENGKRQPSLSQLQALSSALNRSVDFFLSDAPVGAEYVLWRLKPSDPDSGQIETRFLRLCEQYHNLEVWLDERLDADLPVAKEPAGTYHFRHAERLAHEVRKQLGLGDHPAQSLLTVLEETCGVKVFHLGFEPTGTAACTVSEDCGPAVLLNAGSVRWRRNFDLAHEFFHVLTWSIFRKGEGESGQCAGESEEKLANAFASRLLMPDEAVRTELDRSFERGRMTFSRLFDVARKFDVSVEALVWRMVFLDYMKQEEAPRIIERYRNNARLIESGRERDEPPERPVRFMALAYRAVRSGEMSMGRFAEYMGISRSDAKRIMAEAPEDDDEVPIAAT